LLYSDRRTDGMTGRWRADMTRIIVAFCNFGNADKNIQYVVKG